MSKTMTTTLHHDQIFRNQMSVMAWIMCGLCAWIILLAALAAADASRNAHYKTSIQQVDIASES